MVSFSILDDKNNVNNWNENDMKMAVSCENTYVNRHEEIARDILARTKQFSRENM